MCTLVCISVHVCMCVCEFDCVCMCVRMRVSMHVCTCVCVSMHARVCVWDCVCMLQSSSKVSEEPPRSFELPPDLKWCLHGRGGETSDACTGEVEKQVMLAQARGRNK